jgi:ADP-heptose:LPS heptosyltransferase
LGYDVPETRPFLTHPVPYVRGRHEVTQNLSLALAATSQSGIPPATTGDPEAPTQWPLRFSLSAADQAAGQALLASMGNDPIVAIHPGSGAAVKKWRRDGWAALITGLVKRYPVQVVVTGSATEVDLVETISASLGPAILSRVLSLAGRTSLGVLAAVYQRCRLVIGPDSGPLHLAVAVGTPTLHLYGPVDRATFGPWGDAQRHRVLVSDWACVPCNRLDWPEEDLPAHGCVWDISYRDVWQEADRLLAQGMAGSQG